MAAPCRFFAAGNCTKGSSCAFSHGTAPNASTAPAFVPMGRGQGRPSQPPPRSGSTLNPAAPFFRPDSRMLNPPYSTPSMQSTGPAFVPSAPPVRAPPPPHHAMVPSRPPAPHSLFVSTDLAQELLARTAALELLPDTSDDAVPDVDKYHSLLQLDGPTPEGSPVFPYECFLYKAFHIDSGATVALRRVANARITDKMAMTCVDQWRKISHPNIIGVQEVFTTRDFHDYSVVFVSEFQPCCEPLSARFMHRNPVPEPLLWSFVIQLTAALRAIHSAGLACRVIDPSKVLVQGPNRIFVGGVSVLDVMQYSGPVSPAALAAMQQADLEALGRLVLSLACGVPFAETILQQSLLHVSANFSEDVTNLIRYLLASLPPPRVKNLSELMPIIGARFYTEAEARLRTVSTLESDLRKELHNGRLFRLVYKLLLLCDDPSQRDTKGATGDRYLLSLFKDYVFHQETEAGQPMCDLAFAVQALNKLDCGSPEKIMMVSSDERNVIIVSYADLNRCMALEYAKLSHSSG